MKTRALLLALPLLAATGCSGNNASVQIQQICAPKPECTFTNKCDAVAAGNPQIDPAVTKHLTLFLQLENQLPDNADSDLMRLNTNDAHLDEATVEYAGALSGKVTFGVQGAVPAGSTQLAEVDLIPASVGSTLSTVQPAYPLYDEVQAKLRLRGYYDDGTRFETGDFVVTVQLQNGGVQSCATACPHSGQWPNACPTP